MWYCFEARKVVGKKSVKFFAINIFSCIFRIFTIRISFTYTTPCATFRKRWYSATSTFVEKKPCPSINFIIAVFCLVDDRIQGTWIATTQKTGFCACTSEKWSDYHVTGLWFSGHAWRQRNLEAWNETLASPFSASAASHFCKKTSRVLWRVKQAVQTLLA